MSASATPAVPSASSRRLRWGVLGWARIARENVIPAIARSSNGDFCAIASRDPAKLADCRSRWGGVAEFSTYEALISDPGVDAVYLPLPNSLHCEWAVRAAAGGKHVLCEKPMALNVAECSRMTAAATAAGVTLMEAFMYRYTDRVARVLEVVHSGVLGEIRHVASSFRFLLANPLSIKLKPELGGGALYDVGCYPVHFAGMIADAAAGAAPGTIRPVASAATCVREGGIDQIASALLRYPSGLIATVHCGFNAHRRVHAEIIGSRGLLEIPETFMGEAGSLRLTTAEGVSEIPVAESDRYRLEVEDFAAAVANHRPPACGLAETARNCEVLERLLAVAV